MKKMLCVCLGCFCFLALTAEVNAGSKNALVIGNASYSFSPLKNPVNDADDLTESLQDIGFDVIRLTNGTKTEMIRAAQAFQDRLSRRRGVGLFYYAGHAIQVQDKNYLIPVDARLEDTLTLSEDTIKLDGFLHSFNNTSSKANIIILDACRNNPFNKYAKKGSNTITRAVDRTVVVERAKGLATVHAESGTFIAYATSPDREASDGSGRNGTYTKYLLKHIKTAGLTIEELFKKVRVDVQQATDGQQIPWERSSLVEKFYFVKPEKREGGKRRLFGTF